MASGIAAVLAMGSRVLERGELTGLYERACAHSRTQVDQWNDSTATLLRSLRSVEPHAEAASSIAAIPSLALVGTLEGQLHNAADLRADLPVSPHHETDSDLMVGAYARWGESFVGRLRGDFALIVWDLRAKRLLCARDPIGIKSLYLYKTAHSFIVASDLGFLLNLHGRDLPINAKAVAAYLSGNPLTTDTFYEGVVKLTPGTTLVISAQDGAQRRFRHWRVSDIKPVRYTRSEDYADHFRNVFCDAIRCRLTGARRAGLLLSGGLDSSSIACVASRILGTESLGAAALLTLSATSGQCKPDADGEVFDETSYINEVVSVYGIDARFFRYENFLAEDEFSTPRERALPLPPGMGVFSTMLRNAREANVTTMLSGIGGDEVLGANSTIYLLRYADLLSSGDTRELMQDLRHAHQYYPWRKVAGLLWRCGCWPLLKSSFGRWSRDAHRQPRALSASQGQIYVELSSGELAGYGLEAFNLMCEEVGMEARYPYLDTRLVELCLAVPSAELSRHYQTKLLLRRAMAGVLPEKVRLRVGKASSSSLTHTWLSETIRPTAEALLAHPTLSQGVDWDLIRKLFAEYCRGNIGHGRPITKAIGLELWYRANNKGGSRHGFRQKKG